MNKSQLIASISKEMGLSKRQAKLFLDSFFSNIVNILKEEKIISLRGFGAFRVILRKEREIYNPKTKKLMRVPERKIILFRPYKEIKDKIK